MKERLSHFCKRTLRKDVVEYVKYTERLAIVKEFTASDAEQKLYDMVSAFLQRDNTYAIPYRQKQLTTLIIRKLLASSTWALLQTLETIRDRLLNNREGVLDANSDLTKFFDEDEYALIEEIMDETEDDESPQYKIKRSLQKARDTLFENFDADVHERLKLSVNEYLDRYTRYFWALTVFALGPNAVFDLLDEVASSPPGRYCLIKKGTEETSGILYRMSHPLGQYVLNQALNEAVFSGKVTFDISRHTGYSISQVEQLKGHSGYLTLYKYIVSSFDSEEFLLFAGFLQDGSPLTAEQCQKLFECGGSADTKIMIPPDVKKKLQAEI